ncbi:MAG: hypothetical protein ABWY93_31015 [Mycobacterium sp.]
MSDVAAAFEGDGVRPRGSRTHVERPIKYQLNVIGSTVLDVVTSAGGWLFDRVMAGWEVNVLVAELDEVRPLEILGARSFELNSALRAMRKGPHPQALAVAIDVFDRDERVRQAVLAAMLRGSTEVTFWGPGTPARVERTVSPVEHPLTAAAQVFKAHALVAAAAGESSGPTETFFSGGSSFR